MCHDLCYFSFFFFFSSRRRHTRWTGDWSSDVCSSDLASIYFANFNNVSLTAGTNVDNAAIWTRGTFVAQNYNNKAISPLVQNAAGPLYDPYSSLAAPKPDACTLVPAPSSNSLTLYPGTYCGGLTITGVNNVYFKPGTYHIVDGDLYITGVNGVSCPDCTANGSVIPGTTFVLTQTTGNNNI